MKAGDKLWRVSTASHGANPREVSVVSVGRRWALLDCGERCEIRTGEIDGGEYGSPATCWPSREVYEAEEQRRRAWNRLRELVNNHLKPPEGLSAPEIRQLRVQLFGEDA